LKTAEEKKFYTSKDSRNCRKKCGRDKGIKKEEKRKKD